VGRVISELMWEAQTDHLLQSALVKHYTTPCRNPAVEKMQRVQAHGQIRADVDPRVVVDQLWDVLQPTAELRPSRNSSVR
jgi:hypothetical protein